MSDPETPAEPESPGADGRRRPRGPVPGDQFPVDELSPKEFPDEALGTDYAPRRLAATRVAGFAFVGVVAVVAIALLTGSEVKDLPWAAIIGVLVLIGAIFVVGRRRRLPPE